MINKALALIVIFSLAFNIAFVGIWAYLRVRPMPPRPAPVQPIPPPAPAEGLWQQLGLTPEQQRSIVEEWRQVGRQVEAKQAEVRLERAQLINLLQADALDDQAIKATREKMDEDQQAVRELVFDRMLQLRQVLKPEQRRRWLELMLESAGGPKAQPAADGQQPGQPGQLVQPGQLTQPGPRGGQQGAKQTSE